MCRVLSSDAGHFLQEGAGQLTLQLLICSFWNSCPFCTLCEVQENLPGMLVDWPDHWLREHLLMTLWGVP